MIELINFIDWRALGLVLLVTSPVLALIIWNKGREGIIIIITALITFGWILTACQFIAEVGL